MTNQQDAELNLSTRKGKCKRCGTDISSDRAIYCVGCYRFLHVKCPECMDIKGLKAPYFRHKGPAPGRDGSLQECRRCGQKHDDFLQIECPVCHNERYILREAESEK